MKVAKLLWKWRNWHLLFQVLLYVQTSRGQTKQGAPCLSELMQKDRLIICPFLSQYGDGVSINQVFMCHDVFSKSSSILGRWSRTSQWKAGPRDDSHKVFFGISVYVMLSMEMRISFVTHQADDPLQKRRSSPACSLRPSLWSSIRMKATQGLLSNEDSCHRWHPVKWCDPNIDIIHCSFSGKEAMMWGENIICGEYLGMDVGIHYSTFSDKEAFMQQEHHYRAG